MDFEISFEFFVKYNYYILMMNSSCKNFGTLILKKISVKYNSEKEHSHVHKKILFSYLLIRMNFFNVLTVKKMHIKILTKIRPKADTLHNLIHGYAHAHDGIFRNLFDSQTRR